MPTFLEFILLLRIWHLTYWIQSARPCLTMCGLTCVGEAKHQPMVADNLLDTAAAAAPVTMVLKRRLVLSKADSDRDGDERRPAIKENIFPY